MRDHSGVDGATPATTVAGVIGVASAEGSTTGEVRLGDRKRNDEQQETVADDAGSGERGKPICPTRSGLPHGPRMATVTLGSDVDMENVG